MEKIPIQSNIFHGKDLQIREYIFELNPFYLQSSLNRPLCQVLQLIIKENIDKIWPRIPNN